MKKNILNKGITLISLVITIVIMLILAGVSVSLIIGNNGLLKKASNGAQTYKDSSDREKEEFGNAEDELSNLSLNDGNTNADGEKPHEIKKTYLYNAGDTCDSLTGGWTLTANSSYPAGTDISYNSDNITFTSTSSDLLITNKLIDCSKYKYIHFEYSYTKGSITDSNCVGICTHNGTSFSYLKYRNESAKNNGDFSYDFQIDNFATPGNIYIGTNWGGKIVLKSVYMYSDEEDTPQDTNTSICYLYNAGNTYSSVTGGWSLVPNAGTAAGIITFNSDNITFTSNTSDLLMTNNLIDCSKYKYIHFDYSYTKGSRTDSNGVGICTHDSSFKYLKYRNESSTNNGDFSYDLQIDNFAIPGNIYIGTNWGGSIILRSVYMHN